MTETRENKLIILIADVYDRPVEAVKAVYDCVKGFDKMLLILEYADDMSISDGRLIDTTRKVGR